MAAAMAVMMAVPKDSSWVEPLVETMVDSLAGCWVATKGCPTADSWGNGSVALRVVLRVSL